MSHFHPLPPVCRLQLPIRPDEIHLSAPQRQGPNSWLLFKVPADQRRHNPGAYDPYLFTFGPYHAPNFSELSSSDTHHIKQRAAQALLAEGGYEKLVQKIEERDSDIRALYPERRAHIASFPTHDLAALFALDAVAIIAPAVNRDVFEAYPVASLVARDAILLENQIPIFVLQYAIENLVQNTSIREVLEWYSCCFNPFLELGLGDPPLLAYIYDSLTENSTESVTSSNDVLPPTATVSHLRRYGVKFLACDARFNGISFDKKTMALSIPRIRVDEGTTRFLLNLLAYEAISRFPGQFSVVSYVYFMDQLIDSEKDVRLLVEADVIRSGLGSHEEVASLWNKLCIGMTGCTTAKDCGTMEQLNQITKIRWRRWMAAFRQTYWENKPWLLISGMVAAVLPVLTLLQTVYSMKSYYHGN